ncbi:hypothetical protein GCM10010448_21240 [Streptomyces glomeratus]|uniref:B12-binding N-terminal domain-containing protein n=1 Tax=Streptomyces glomeratus TaxID=284452 RepID=A0ABP6LGJ8_9ACTN|nr:B12-binding domain-containing protein [Streptomyces glomeratus]MCF1511623.1 hypothetical protein [Streptomyces glomeratus]
MSAAPVRTAATAGRDAVRDRLWQAGRAGGEDTASAVALATLRDGTGVEAVPLDPIAPVQARVVTEWAAGRLTVARERAATAVHDRVIAALAHRPGHRGEPPVRACVVVACVNGERHTLPARLFAEVLRLRGRRVDFLGARVRPCT